MAVTHSNTLLTLFKLSFDSLSLLPSLCTLHCNCDVNRVLCLSCNLSLSLPLTSTCEQFCLSCQKSGNAFKFCRCACCALCGPRRRSSIFTRLPYCCDVGVSVSVDANVSVSVGTLLPWQLRAMTVVVVVAAILLSS